MWREIAVKRCRVTISAEQQKDGPRRCDGLDVEIRLQDYRDLHDSFDRIVSIGMFEHVVPKITPPTLVADRNLNPTAASPAPSVPKSPTITLTRGSINIFNGCLPSVRQIADAGEKHFVMEDWLPTSAPITTPPHGLASVSSPAGRKYDNYSERFSNAHVQLLPECLRRRLPRPRHSALAGGVLARGIEHGLRVAR